MYNTIPSRLFKIRSKGHTEISGRIAASIRSLELVTRLAYWLTMPRVVWSKDAEPGTYFQSLCKFAGCKFDRKSTQNVQWQHEQKAMTKARLRQKLAERKAAATTGKDKVTD